MTWSPSARAGERHVRSRETGRVAVALQPAPMRIMSATLDQTRGQRLNRGAFGGDSCMGEAGPYHAASCRNNSRRPRGGGKTDGKTSCARWPCRLMPHAMFARMLLRWVLSVFPAEMASGWRLVRPDLLLWAGLSALLAVSALALPPGTPDTSAPVLPAIIGLATAVITATLPPVLFTAAATGREVTWAQVWRYLLLRAPIMLMYWILALLVAFVPAVSAGEMLSIILSGTVAEIPVSAAAAMIVFIIFAVRFSFLPFLAILYERGQIDETLWHLPQAPWLGRLAWPLVASARLSENVRWNLTPYVVLVGVIPNLPRMLENALLLPAEVLCQLVALTVQGVLFNYFCAQGSARGIPAVTLLETEPATSDQWP